MVISRLVLVLPGWLRRRLEAAPRSVPTVEARMRFVLSLARENVQRRTGGPFAAAVFEQAGGRLIGAGVNCVVPARASWAHAEMVALWAAQRTAGTYDLGSCAFAPCELVSSAEPCAMCLGALPWSGIRALVCGATDADVRGIGFDEGDKPRGWESRWRRRGIAVQRGVLRSEAVAVLRLYRREGGPIYHP